MIGVPLRPPQGRAARGVGSGAARHGEKMTARPLRILLLGAGPGELAERLRRVAPRAEFLLADDPVEGERLLEGVDAVIAGARVTPAYARAPVLRWLHLTGAGIDAQAIPELRDAPCVLTHKAL